VVAIPLQNELPAGSPVTTPLSTRPFDIKLNPGGTRVHLTHDLGQFVTVRAMQDGTVTEPVTTTLTGIDRSDFLVADLAGIPEIRLVYTDVSSPTRGRVCMVLLDAEGIPSGDPVCEQNSTRPRPDSDLAVLRPLPTGSAAVPSPVRRTH
jgi:hypothetical protein